MILTDLTRCEVLRFFDKASLTLPAKIVTTVAISTFDEGMLKPDRVIDAGIVISMRASLKGSRVGDKVVGLFVGLVEGAEELLGLVLGVPDLDVGLKEILGGREGKSDGLIEGGSMAYEYINSP